QLRGLLKILRRVIAALFIKLVVKVPHHIIFRLGPARCAADRKVEHHVHDLALVVVRDLVIDGVLILTVILDPCVKTRFFQACLKPAWCRLQILDAAGLALQIFLFGGQSGTAKKEAVVILRSALSNPEKLRVILILIVEWAESIRSNTLDIEAVK